ncbi:hypothetical protein YDYSY3_39500 [Paenibacillus chitinolyticus]|uniref:hypothetical protein n=1 Tax=Paenibacillus chitinolyticus TaxID=79263 RepID=UPI0026E502C1|nr:hypothetical protein [Paenibacillus chitinolyticus]GKS12950.1 hypothetical protein YDYSY3_39500 [Paenibacillus chitinolyticus]
MNYFGKIFVVIVAALLLFIWPVSEVFERQDDIAHLTAYKAVTTFVDAVRNKGYISPQMYNDFVLELSKTGNVYDIELEHQHKRYNPVYSDPANPGTFQNTFKVDYEAFYRNQIMPILFPSDSTAAKTDESRKYKFTEGDYFAVVVKNKNKTNAGQMRDFLNGGISSDNTRIYIPYGGMVTNEDY